MLAVPRSMPIFMRASLRAPSVQCVVGWAAVYRAGVADPVTGAGLRQLPCGRAYVPSSELVWSIDAMVGVSRSSGRIPAPATLGGESGGSIFTANARIHGRCHDARRMAPLHSLRRSEERRVGKECRSWWWADDYK